MSNLNQTRSSSRVTTAPGGSSTLMSGIMGAVSPQSRANDARKRAEVATTKVNSATNHLRIGMFGGGVVGGGTYELIRKCAGNGRFESAGASMEVAKICVRSLDKPRDYQIDSSTTFTTNYNDILDDDSINTVVELMGGITDAKDVVFSAISKGKHVVTANKALIATYLPEIITLLEANPNVKFAYEAAVCGGIPIIHSLHGDFLSDTVTKVMGIMNGTTNFMLCKMENGASYDAVLKEAQALGFAEANPSADVDGYDLQAKIAILAKLSYGKSVALENIPTSGISMITTEDFAYAKSLNSTIKCLGTAALNDDGSLAVFVSSTVVPLDNPLATAKGPGNMVLLNTENNTQSILAGPGAGRYPTANSVMNDLIRMSQGFVSPPFPVADTGLQCNSDYVSKFYIRIKCTDQLGIIGAVGQAAEESGVSIHAVLQNPIEDHENLNFVITTEPVNLSNIVTFVASITRREFVKGEPVYMPML